MGKKPKPAKNDKFAEAQSLLKEERWEDAATLLEELTEEDPRRFQCWSLLGVARHNLGQYEPALAAFEEILRRVDIPPAGACYQASVAAESIQRHQLAIRYARMATELSPETPEFLLHLGSLLNGRHCYEEAEEILRRGIELNEKNPHLLVALGESIRDQGRVGESESYFQKALELAPKNPAIRANVSLTHEKLNQVDEARKAAEKSLEINPQEPSAHLALAKCEFRQKEYEKAVNRLKPLLETVCPNSKAGILNELGMCYDKLGQTDDAFGCFTESKRILRERQEDLEELKEEGFRTITVSHEVFTPSFLRTQTPAPPFVGAPSPIFVIGFPRSGTTLLDQILDSHSRLQTMEERPTGRAAVLSLQAYGEVNAKTLAQMTPNQFAHARAAYFAEVAKYVTREPGSIVVDRQPFNTSIVGPLHRIFPQSKFVMAIRHPLDVCLSCFMQNFGVNSGTAHFFSLEEGALYYARTMYIWRHFVELLPMDYHIVRYEDLVVDQEGTTRALLDFLELEWDDAVLRYFEKAREKARENRVRTASYQQVIQPIYSSAKYRWKRYQKYLEPIMETLAPFIEYFGYDETAAGPADCFPPHQRRAFSESREPVLV